MALENFLPCFEDPQGTGHGRDYNRKLEMVSRSEGAPAQWFFLIMLDKPFEMESGVLVYLARVYGCKS